MTFQVRLRQLRKDKGLTQSEFGKIFSLSKQTLSGYEKGDNNPPLETTPKIAD
ncbi:MAG: Helix-turn-helix domain [Sporomusa sp.]|nr:Helix-turn-helix domain [Sporomusa sp.]